MLFSIQFKPSEQTQKRQTAKEKHILSESTKKLAMQKIMNHSLRAAAHTSETGHLIEDTLGHPAIFRRIEEEIKQQECYSCT